MNHRKKMLLVCSSLGGGGAERVALNIGDELMAGHNADVTVFYWDRKVSKEYKTRSPVGLIRSKKRSLFHRIVELSKLLKITDYDAAIGFTDIPNIILWAASILSGSKATRISTIHTDLRERDANISTNLIKKMGLRWLHSLACRSSYKVVTVSEGAAASAKDYLNIRSNKVCTIYNPVLLVNDFSVVKDVNTFPIRIVSAGRLTQAKDYKTLVSAMEILVKEKGVDCMLTIFGEGPLKEDIQRHIRMCELQQNVFLAGFINDLDEQLQRYDVFVLSSKWEGFSNVLVEALSKGLRVVSTDCHSGPREILANGRFGLLAPVGSPQGLSEAIYNIVSRNIDHKQNTEIKAHLEKFTVSEATSKYLSLLERQ